MPPCAAMLCARRGESWKQKHLTLYPSSLSDAAADPPASPDPTTITVYFRLFAGFTSFISNRCLLHFFSIGPEGALDFSSMAYRMTPAITPTGTIVNPSHTTTATTSAMRRCNGCGEDLA